MAEKLLPVVKSMVLCEDALPGPAGTGNVHLMNVFSNIRPRSEPAFPYHLAQLCVFLQLTDVEGQAPGHILGYHPDSGRIVLSSTRHPIQFRDRLQVKWVVFRLKDCSFPEGGVYWMSFISTGNW